MRASSAETESAHHPAELHARWERASSELEVISSMSTEQSALKYHLDLECPLVYDFDAMTTITQIQPESRHAPHVQQIVGRFDLRPDDGSLDKVLIQNRAAGRYQIRNNMRSQGKEYWPGQLPNIYLENRGNSVQLIGDDAPLWNSFGAFRGLVYFFPALPDTSAGETQTSWTTDFRSPENHFPEHAQAAPFDQIDSQVQLVQWIQVDGTPAAVLETRQAISNSETSYSLPEGDIRQTWQGNFFGRYVILQTGRLLHAALSQTATVNSYDTNADNKEPKHTFQQTTIAEARLTGACSGPSLPTFKRNQEQAQRAVDTYTRFIYALNDREFDRIEQFIAPDVLNAHGKDHVVELIKGHLHRYGNDALGGPTLAESVEADGALFQFRVVGRAQNFEGEDQPNLTVVTYVTIEKQEDDMTILSLRTTSSQTSNEGNVLEISPERIFSRQ